MSAFVCVTMCTCSAYTPQVDVAWFYRNCLTDTCNCNRGGDCECLCTSIAAYAHKCCQQGVTIHWRSPSACREYTHTDAYTHVHSTPVYFVLVRDMTPAYLTFTSSSLHQPMFCYLSLCLVITYIFLKCFITSELSGSFSAYDCEYYNQGMYKQGLVIFRVFPLSVFVSKYHTL